MASYVVFFEQSEQFFGSFRACVGAFLQALGHDIRKIRRQHVDIFRGHWPIVIGNLPFPAQGEWGPGMFSANQFVQENAARPEVRSMIELCAAQLFWRHITKCAQGPSGFSSPNRRNIGLIGLRQAKIDEFHRTARVNHDVFRLQITVDNVALVNMNECAGDGNHHLEGQTHARLLLLQKVTQREPVNVFDRHVGMPKEITHLVNRYGVRMSQVGQNTPFRE